LDAFSKLLPSSGDTLEKNLFKGLILIFSSNKSFLFKNKIHPLSAKYVEEVTVEKSSSDSYQNKYK
jgi:hypothetical protein